MQIVIPAERAGETRVAATPETVKKLVQLGCSVAVQSGAGLNAAMPDAAYADAGAEVVADRAALLARGDIGFAESWMDEQWSTDDLAALPAQLAEGNVALCRDLTEALVDWFPGHATHLDSALAHWLSKQRFGGKPVVIRRNILSSAESH